MLTKRRYRLISLALVLMPHYLSGQTLDSAMAEHTYSKYVLSSDVADMNFREYQEDTSLHFLHLVHPLKERALGWLDQGQIGTPAIDLWGNGAIWPSRLRNTGAIMDYYGYKNSETKYYFGSQPRSDLMYAQGTGDLIYLKAEHAQNIFSRWSFGLDYTRIKSNNVYYGNLSDFTKVRIPNHYFTRLYSHFYTQNLKYEVFTSLSWNKSRIAETGGISDVNRFDTLEGRNKYFFNEAQLQDAENALMHSHWQVLQFFRPGSRLMRSGDTMIADSQRSTLGNQWFHQMDLHWDRSNFSDPASVEAYYPTNIYSFTTNDSIRVFNLINRFGYQIKSQEGRAGLRIYTEHEYARMQQFPGHTARYNNLRLGASYSRKSGDNNIRLETDVVPTGYFAGDYRLSGAYTRSRGNWNLEMELASMRSEPAFNAQYFGSNHYYWHQDLTKTGNSQVKLSLRNDTSGLCGFLAFDVFDGYVYYDTASRPVQVGGSFSRFRAGLNWKANLGKHLHFIQELGWQQNREYLRLPEFVSKSRVYWEGWTFKGNMRLRGGFDVYYMSAFNGLSYNPVIREFHWDDSRSSGGYPMFDLFVNAKVNTMEIFFLWQHISDGVFGYDFYSANSYPLLYRSMRFGLKWRLFN